MIDFEVKRCTRRCAATDQPLAPGDRYISVLVAEGADVVRRDYAATAWQAPPEGAIGWWQARVPDDGASKPKLAPSEVALELFDRWLETVDRAEAVYVLALFLVRKRVFRFSESAFPNGVDEKEVLQLYCPSRAAEYEVPVVAIDDARASEIQAELIELLYSDAA